MLRFEAGYHTKQSGLAAAGGAKQSEKFTLLYIKTKVRDDNVLTIFFQCMLYADPYAHGSVLLIV